MASSFLISQLTPFPVMVKQALDLKEIKRDMYRYGARGMSITFGLCRTMDGDVLGFLEKRPHQASSPKEWIARNKSGIRYGYVKDRFAWCDATALMFKPTTFEWVSKPVPWMRGVSLDECFDTYLTATTKCGYWDVCNFGNTDNHEDLFDEVSKPDCAAQPHEISISEFGELTYYVASVMLFTRTNLL